MERIVLAYSGGLDTSVAIPWLMERYNAEVITLSVFVPFAIFYMKEPPKLDYLWAGLCILGAVFFIFRSKWTGA